MEEMAENEGTKKKLSRKRQPKPRTDVRRKPRQLTTQDKDGQITLRLKDYDNKDREFPLDRPMKDFNPEDCRDNGYFYRGLTYHYKWTEIGRASCRERVCQYV